MKELVTLTFLVISFLAPASTSASKKSDYTERIHNLNTVIDIRMNDLVEEQIDFVVNKKSKDSRYILGRTSLYFPKIENALRSKGLPDELKYIAVIESSLQPDAVSRQGATGLWQFMKGTAQLYGMEVSKYIDERRDIEISTDKALDYLQVLYNIYGNWTIALAAYNCGPGNLNKAIKKAGGSTNYWKVAPFLPKETREYVPKFIAMSYLMNYYYLHDLEPIEPAEEYKNTGIIKMYNKTSFKSLSEELSLDISIIKKLNPIYVKDIIPQNDEGKYFLILPEPVMFTYLEKTKRFEDLVFLSSYVNNTATNDGKNSLLTNASDQNKSDMLFLKSNMREVVSEKISDYMSSIKYPRNNAAKKHFLKRKESLVEIALTYQIPLEKLMEINNIKSTDEVSINSEIILH